MENKVGKKEIKRAFLAALPYTAPVFMGYIFLGMAFGALLASRGYGLPWALIMSVLIYAGSMQFVAIGLLSGPFDPLGALIITLGVNLRHIFYGLSMLTKYKDYRAMKPYMIFSLTDETFSVLCALNPREGVDHKWFMFFVSFLNQIYWVTGSILGSVGANAINFNPKGIDFAMTALFIVIFIEQWEKAKNHVPALVGLFATSGCLLLFGSQSFIVFSMAAIVVILLAAKGRIKMGVERDGD